MLSRYATLSLSRAAAGENEVVLISRVCWTLVRAQNELCEASVGEVDWALNTSGHSCIMDVRCFLAEARHPGSSSVDRMDDHQVLETVRIGLRTGWLVAVHKGSGKTASSSASQEMRQLVAQIEEQTHSKLSYRGRRFKLALAQDLAGLPDRDYFEVVSQSDAQKILDGVASEQPSCSETLAKARGKLSKDWQPPSPAPDGLVLLRRLLARASSSKDEGPALTPSQLQQMRAPKEAVDPLMSGAQSELDMSEVELPVASEEEQTPADSAGSDDSGQPTAGSADSTDPESQDSPAKGAQASDSGDGEAGEGSDGGEDETDAGTVAEDSEDSGDGGESEGGGPPEFW